MAAAQNSYAELLRRAISKQSILMNRSGQLMVDPVQLPDGFTYERADITIHPPPLMVTNYTIRNIIGAIQANDEDLLELALSCPITQTLFVNPVICSGDGHTFSKLNIEQWLVRDNPGANFMTSPSTRQSCGDLTTNETLILFMREIGLQPTMRDQAPATRRLDLRTILRVVPKILHIDGRDRYSRKTKEFLLLYLQNQHPDTSPTKTLLTAMIQRLRTDLGIGEYKASIHGSRGGYKIYKSKSKINKRKHSRKHKHSRSHKHSRKRG